MSYEACYHHESKQAKRSGIKPQPRQVSSEALIILERVSSAVCLLIPITGGYAVQLHVVANLERGVLLPFAVSQHVVAVLHFL